MQFVVKEKSKQSCGLSRMISHTLADFVRRTKLFHLDVVYTQGRGPRFKSLFNAVVLLRTFFTDIHVFNMAYFVYFFLLHCLQILTF
jgi:hypothetical protein